MAPRPTPAASRFWNMVRRAEGTNECWLWTGAIRQAFGYGMFSIAKGQNISTHRYSWELHFGAIPHGLEVLHKCDNPRCVNPDHLFLGTQKDNIQDAKAKGRLKAPVGIINGQSKLTEDEVRRIKILRGQRIPLKTIAMRFGVSIALVSMIASGKRWPHITEGGSE
mgnify:CR=1 FL=1